MIGAAPWLINNRLEFFEAQRDRLGDVYRLNLGLMDVLVLNQPRHVDYILRSNARNYVKQGPLWTSLRTLIGDGLATAEGETWRKKRRTVQPHFSHAVLPRLSVQMLEAIDECIAEWSLSSMSTGIDVAQGMSRLTVRVVGKALFGNGLSNKDADIVNLAMSSIGEHLFQGVATSALPPWFPVPGRARHQRLIAQVDDIVADLIRSRHDSATRQEDLLQSLLDGLDDPRAPGAVATLRDDAVTLFLTGHETTAQMLGWSLFELGRNPEIQQRLADEIDSVVGDRRPTFEDLPRLSYTRQLLCESLRRYAPVYWLGRAAREADEIDGFPVRPGQTVIALSHVLHHHPDHWQNPTRFEPERFAPERVQQRHPLAWVPFGAGNRQCIGVEFALMEGQLTLCRILQRFRLTPAAGYVTRKQVSTTIRPRGGVWLCLSQRQRASDRSNEPS